MAGEALAMTMFIPPAVSDPQRTKLHRARAQRQLARAGVAIAHHPGVPLFVARAAMALDIIINLRLECCDQHPPGTLARDLVQQ
jgi:hypothetical protein